MRKAIPVQVWSPMFHVSPLFQPFSCDIQIAERVWRGEDRIWLLPTAKRIVRWRTLLRGFCFFECMIPSRTFNVITIFHVDDEGNIYPPLPLPEQWLGSLPPGLYREWTEAESVWEFRDELIAIKMPVYGDRTLSFEAEVLRLSSRKEEDEEGYFLFFGDSRPPRMVEPFVARSDDEVEAEGEGAEVWFSKFVPPKFTKRATTVRNLSGNDKILNLAWCEPFSLFFPFGALDTASERNLMRDCIERSDRGDHDGPLRQAEARTSRLVGQTQVWLEKCWFMPKAIRDVDDALSCLYQTLGIEVSSLEELAKSRNYRERLMTPVKIPRIYGWLGYFWREFYQDLVANTTIKLCQRCGRVIRGGHADRQYCTAQENSECYRERKAEDQRRRRDHLSSQRDK